jgi:hypothetical protein
MSIIYNVTVKVEGSIAESWLEWMMNEHIPEVLSSECFYDYRIFRLLEVDDTEGPTFAIQYMAQSKADYNNYIENYAEGMRKKTFNRWGEKFIAFRSVMAVVK